MKWRTVCACVSPLHSLTSLAYPPAVPPLPPTFLTNHECNPPLQDLSTGAELTRGGIPGMSGNFEWAADNATLFYVVKDHLDRPYKVGGGWRAGLVGGSGRRDGR